MKIKCVNYLSVVLFLQLSTAMIVKNIQSFYFCPDWAPGFFNDFYPLSLSKEEQTEFLNFII